MRLLAALCCIVVAVLPAAQAAPARAEEPAGDVQAQLQPGSGTAVPPDRFQALDLRALSASWGSDGVRLEIQVASLQQPNEARVVEASRTEVWFTGDGTPFLLQVVRSLPAADSAAHVEAQLLRDDGDGFSPIADLPVEANLGNASLAVAIPAKALAGVSRLGAFHAVSSSLMLSGPYDVVGVTTGFLGVDTGDLPNVRDRLPDAGDAPFTLAAPSPIQAANLTGTAPVASPASPTAGAGGGSTTTAAAKRSPGASTEVLLLLGAALLLRRRPA